MNAAENKKCFDVDNVVDDASDFDVEVAMLKIDVSLPRATTTTTTTTTTSATFRSEMLARTRVRVMPGSF